MITIRRAVSDDSNLISEMGRITFIDAHGTSMPGDVIEAYCQQKYNLQSVKDDLEKPNNLYHLIFVDSKPAGYSKIIFNETTHAIQSKNVTKLERLYILSEYYDLKIGKQLFDFNVTLSKENGQSGIWLYVWIGNERALRFYKKNKFEMIGTYDFQLTEGYHNPNYQMLLRF